MSNRPFTATERQYLLTLPAVDSVHDDCITYAAWFRADCMRRVRSGEQPVRIFSNAGLDPHLIGLDHISRCIERWHDDQPITIRKPFVDTMHALDRLTAETALRHAMQHPHQSI